MGLSVYDLEPGGVYKGYGGQLREIVAFDGRMLSYRLIKVSFIPGPTSPKKDDVRTITRKVFAEWALEEVA